MKSWKEKFAEIVYEFNKDFSRLRAKNFENEDEIKKFIKKWSKYAR